MKEAATSHSWHDLAREGRLVWTWWHAAVLLIVLPFTIQSVTASMGLSDRNLLILGRAAAPLLGIAVAPGLILRDVSVGAAELVATTWTGLGRVWLTRFVMTLIWSVGALLLFMGPLLMRVQTRYVPTVEMAASIVDLLLFMAVASAAAHRLVSPTAGQVVGVILWSAGLLLGTRPPVEMPWLGYLAPLSPYFFGPFASLLLNRLLWGGLALFLILRESYGLSRAAIFTRKE